MRATPPHLALLALLCALAHACAHQNTTSTNAVPHIIKHISATPTPEPPTSCSSASQNTTPLTAEPRATLYIFVSDWCASCHRTLQTLESNQNDLIQRGVNIEQVVIGQGPSCFDAARVASEFPFAYRVAPSNVQEAWGVRSTPTLWLVTPQQEAVLYLEGMPPWKTFLDALDEALIFCPTP